MDAAGDWLCIQTNKARQVLDGLKEGKSYDVEIKEHREKRSLDSNAYAWVLIDRLAEKLHIPKTEVYRRYIRGIGGNNETVCIPDKGVEKLRSGWEHMSDLEQTAIERLKAASDMSLRLFEKPLVITYSGGKDSDVLLHLAEKSGIPFETLHSLTTADAPETVRHVYDTFRRLEEKGVKCTVDKHVQPDGSRMTMWKLIQKKLMPPTRLVRYCCAALKEGGGKDRFIATGVRWAESTARKRRGGLEVLTSKPQSKLILSNDNDEDRRLFETCQLKGKRVVNPIIDWKDNEVLD